MKQPMENVAGESRKNVNIVDSWIIKHAIPENPRRLLPLGMYFIKYYFTSHILNNEEKYIRYYLNKKINKNHTINDQNSRIFIFSYSILKKTLKTYDNSLH